MRFNKKHKIFTISFIPHEVGGKIRNIVISNYLIIFFILVFITIILVSIYSTRDREQRNSEKYLLSYKYKNDEEFFIDLINVSFNIEDELKKIQNNISILNKSLLHTSLEMENKNIDIYDVEDGFNFFKGILKNFDNITNNFLDIKTYIETRYNIYKQIPFDFPVRGYITSFYGWRRNPFNRRKYEFHDGIDIGARWSTKIYATAQGKIFYSGWLGGYGYVIIISHDYGYKTIYGHCSRLYVRKNQQVEKNQLIGRVGSSGRSTGSHCHYEIRLDVKKINPNDFIKLVW